MKDKHISISVSGPPASGKTILAQLIGQFLMYHGINVKINDRDEHKQLDIDTLKKRVEALRSHLQVELTTIQMPRRWEWSAAIDPSG